MQFIAFAAKETMPVRIKGNESRPGGGGSGCAGTGGFVISCFSLLNVVPGTCGKQRGKSKRCQSLREVDADNDETASNEGASPEYTSARIHVRRSGVAV